MTNIILTEDGRLRPAGEEALSRVIEQLRRKADPKLLLHVHGGLVSQDSAERAARILDGAEGGTSYAPLLQEGWVTSYLVWRSSASEAIRANQDELAGDPLFNRYIYRLIAWIGGSKLQPEGAAAASLSVAEIRTAVGSDWDLAPLADELAEDQLLRTNVAQQLLDDRDLLGMQAQITAAPESAPLALNIDPDVRLRIQTRALVPSLMKDASSEMLPSAADWVLIALAARAGLRVLRRIASGRDHGPLPTIVEEIGRAIYGAKLGARVWGLMKKDLSDHFIRDRAGDVLLDAIADVASANEKVRLLLVVHSAGSVFACHLAREAMRLPQNVIIDVVMLAPAVSMNVVAEFLVRSRNRLNGLRIFTMEDEREQQDNLDDTLFGKIYSRSLLYLISGVLEERDGSYYPDAPLLGLQRHHTIADGRLDRDERVTRHAIREFTSGRIVFAPSENPAGRRSDANTHGTIDNDPMTIESILEVARSGI